MTKTIPIIIITLLSGIFLITGNSWAACRFESGRDVTNKVREIPINENNQPTTLSGTPGGNDVNFGPIFFRFGGSDIIEENILCDSGTAYIIYELVDTPQGGPVRTYGTREMYRTNLDGYLATLGDNYKYGRKTSRKLYFSQGKSYVTTGASVSVEVHNFGRSNRVNYGVIEGSSLPSGRVYIAETADADYDSTTLKLGEFKFTGSVTIQNPTCDVPANKVVTMSDVNNIMNGMMSTSPWVDSSITVVCNGEFHGGDLYYSQSKKYNPDSGEWDLHGYQYSGVPQSTSAYILIKPVHGYESGTMTWDDGDPRPIEWSRNAVIAIENIPGESATGIGIQLSRNQTEAGMLLYRSEDDALLASSSPIEPGVTTFNIPLYARYIQTNNNRTYGLARSRVTYTLYYK